MKFRTEAVHIFMVDVERAYSSWMDENMTKTKIMPPGKRLCFMIRN